MLSHPKTARNGNLIASVGMLIAIITTVNSSAGLGLKWIAIAMIVGSLIGGFFAIKVKMTQISSIWPLF